MFDELFNMIPEVEAIYPGTFFPVDIICGNCGNQSTHEIVNDNNTCTCPHCGADNEL